MLYISSNPPPLENLTLESLAFNGNMVEADIGLRHPFLGLTEFTGFDVCGVLISHGSISGFVDPDLLLPGPDDLHLANPDGFTRWWNPAEFPINNGTMFCYKDGLLGTFDSTANYDATLNGYKYFCEDFTSPDDPMSVVDPAGRGVFPAGAKVIRHYSIDMGSGGLVFNYAVDANWQFPIGAAPWDVPGDFPPGANRKEAWNISPNIIKNTLWNDGANSGGALELSIDVYDWFNGGSNLVTVESPANLIAAVDVAPTGSGVGYSTFEVDIKSATPAQNSIDLLVTAECEAVGYGNLLPGKTQAAYFIISVPVSGESPSHPLDLIDVTPPGWPATLQDVWLDGNYAYCVGPWGGLLILDISGSGDPTYLGGHITGGQGLEVQPFKNYCYVADGSNGLVVFDVSDPSNPNPVGSYPTIYSFDGIYVTDDGFCYAANGKGGVLILDIGGGTQGGSPENPQPEGEFAVSYAARDIFVFEGIAYVSDYETRFLAIDVGGGTHGGSPNNPQWESEIAPLNTEEIFAEGGYAYVCDQSKAQFYTIDISIPAKMQLVDTDITKWPTMDLWVDGGYLYTAQYSDGLVIYSLVKPDNPAYASGFKTPGFAFGVFETEDIAYVADYYYGLHKVDVSDPMKPADAGKYFTPSLIYDVQVNDGYLYAADGTCGMAVVDIGGGGGSPTAPLTVARWTQPSGDTDARGIWVEGGYAYIGGGYSNHHLTIADVGAGSGSPSNPIAVGDDWKVWNCLYGMQKMGKYLYAAGYYIDGGTGGLEVYDVDGGTMGGSPSNPKRTCTKPICTTWELYTDDGYVYVACGQSMGLAGLYVFDAGGGSGAPDSPTLADSFPTEEFVYDVNVLNGYAFTCGGGEYLGHWMRVFDVGASIGAPDNIVQVGYYDFSKGVLVRGLGVMEGYVLLVPGQSDSALIAIDVGGGQAGGAPDNPQYVDDVKFPIGTDAFCVAIDGQYAYVGTNNFGLRVVQLWQ